MLTLATAARAADAIVAAPDPEPVEYVRVCNAAGKGFFYIPGTENCLSIRGYVRYDAAFGSYLAVTSDTGDETWAKHARAMLKVSTWSATDLGDLNTYVEMQMDWDTLQDTANHYTEGSFSIPVAYIQLGGLQIGVNDSAFVTYPDYAGDVINDGLYGPFTTNLISYTFTNDSGFSAILSLEQGDGAPGWLIDDYVPHVVAGLGFEQDNWGVKGVVAWDSRDGAGRGGLAATLRGDVKFNDSFSAFAMLLYAEAGTADSYGVWVTNGADTFSVIAGASATLSDSLALNGQIQWQEGNGGSDVWYVAANANYTVVPGFVVTPEVNWLRDNAGDSYWGGLVRFEREF